MEDKREFLETKARQARELVLTAIASFGNGHVGGSMSIMDALAVLFYDAMRLDDQDPDWPHQKLDNLTVLLDCNKGQVDGFVADIEAVAPHEPKGEAFGWDVQDIRYAERSDYEGSIRTVYLHCERAAELRYATRQNDP